MAVIWKKLHNQILYEVRGAGNTRRLYTDGVLHSQYNPQRCETGSIWDLLLLPSLFYQLPNAPLNIQRVLCLGVGGGSVIHLLKKYLPGVDITAVEINPNHIDIGRRFFDLNQPGISLICADAVEWVKSYDGPTFDLIIDDLYFEQNGEPQRATPPNKAWCGHLLKRLTPHGCLTMNFVALDEIKQANQTLTQHGSTRFPSRFSFSRLGYDNRVGGFIGFQCDSKQLRYLLRQYPNLNPEKKTSRLKYRLRSLK